MKRVHSLARALGWLSLALGLTEILGGRSLARLLGAPRTSLVVRGFGVREVVSGLGILASPRPAAGWLWARVAGDAMDLAGLEAARRSPGTAKRNILLSLVAVGGVTLLDLWCAEQLQRRRTLVRDLLTA